MDIKDETSPRKFTSLEGEDKTTVVGDQNSDDIKNVNIGKKSDLKEENCAVRELNCW